MKSSEENSDVLGCFHSDVCGKMEADAVDGSKYFVTFMDDFSRHTVVYFMETKESILDCFKDYHASMEKKTG